MAATEYDIILEQDVSEAVQLNLVQSDGVTPITETVDGTAKLQCRPDADSKQVYFTLTDADGITLDNTNKRIIIDFADELTVNLTFTTGVYDLFWYPLSGVDKKIVKGTITIDKRVTR